MNDLLRRKLSLSGSDAVVLEYLVVQTYGSLLESGGRSLRLTSYILEKAGQRALWLWPDLPVGIADHERLSVSPSLPPVQVSMLLERTPVSHLEAASRMILIAYGDYCDEPGVGQHLQEACRSARWVGRDMGLD